MRLGQDFEQQEGVWVPRWGRQPFAYSDGPSTEAALRSILQVARDRSSLSDELRGRICDWPSRYHLSPERSNLVRCLGLRPEARVMEIGAGCGAVTRYLGEQVSELVALEGSQVRAEICRLRCCDLDNVQVVAGDAFLVEPEPRFDLVTLIGVLEYAGRYGFTSVDPWQQLIQRAAGWLRPGGQLLVAIENQFGIKYFTGCREDHGMPRFSGIEGYPDSTGVRTFGRHVLRRRLEAAGFTGFELLLPFPDYKIPNTFINARFAGAEEAERYGLADWCRRPFSDYVRPRDYLFDDHLALTELAHNGLLAEVSNSFLFVATLGASQQPAPTAELDWIARRYSIHRHPHYQSQTVLAVTASGVVRVHKERVDSKQPTKVQTGCLHQDLGGAEDYVFHGESMALCMLRALRRQVDGERRFADLLRQWLGFFGEEHLHEGQANLLRGEYVDCIPDNLLRGSDGRWHFIDREWSWTEPVSVDWLFYRGLRSLWFHHCIAIAGVAARQPGAWAPFVARAFELLGSPLSDDEWQQVQHQEARLQHVVRAGPGGDAPGRSCNPVVPLPAQGWSLPGRLSIVLGRQIQLPS